MMAIGPNHAIAVFQYFIAIDVMHSSNVFCTIGIYRTVNIHRPHTARIFVVLIAVRLDRCVAVCLVDVAYVVILIPDLVHPPVASLAQIVIAVSND